MSRSRASILLSFLRYQDFHVKEIDNDGNVLELDELITRSKIADEIKEEEHKEDAFYDSLGPQFNFKESDKAGLLLLLSQDDFGVLELFLQTPISEDAPFCTLSSDKLNGDKDNRKQFHALIRNAFGSFLSTDTFESDKTRSIRVWIRKFHQDKQNQYKADFSEARRAPGGRNKKHKLNDGTASVGVMMKDPWPKDRPEYLHFRLYKENRDTAEAIQSISRCLRIPPKSFQFAGTKDRRGITVQSVSVYRISMDAMKRAILHSSWDKAIRISHMEYKPHPNKIGVSGGNHFVVAIKNIPETVTDIDLLFNQLKSNGFPNYYGLQRFGSRNVRTHTVGGLLMAQEWKQVVDILLSPEADKLNVEETGVSTTPDDRNAWRHEYAAGNMDKAHELCQSYLYIEKALLRSLSKPGQSANYLNAIISLPSTTVQLYLHSVQSLIFNATLSHRLRTFGHSKIVIGDLVQETDGKIIVIQSEEQANAFQASSLVIPLVGSQVVYPPNLEMFLSNHVSETLGFSIDVFRDTDLPKILQLPGAYRTAIARVENLEWRILDQVKSSDVVIQSDVDRLKGIDFATQEKQSDDTSPPAKAVVFECSLKPGSYLTMAIREVTSAQ